MLIAVVVISGYLLPWSLGDTLDVFGVGIPSPMDASPALHEFLERLHDVAGHLFVPLLALHVAGAVKHAIFDRRGAAMRMVKPAPGAGEAREPCPQVSVESRGETLSLRRRPRR